MRRLLLLTLLLLGGATRSWGYLWLDITVAYPGAAFPISVQIEKFVGGSWVPIAATGARSSAGPLGLVNYDSTPDVPLRLLAVNGSSPHSPLALGTRSGTADVEWHGTVTVTGAFTATWSGTTSGTASATYPKSAWGQTLTNDESFVVRYRFRIDYATGEDFEEIFSLQPGEVRTLSVANAVGFVPSVEVERVLPDGLGTAWVATTGLNPVTTTTESTATTPTNSGSTAAGNIWDTTTAPGRLGTQTPIAATPSPRDDTAAASADALQRLLDSNADKRHAELKSLLVAADNAQARRDTVALDSSIAGLAGIRAQVAASGAAVVASLEAGKNNAPQTYGTTAATTGAQAGAGAAAGSLGGLIPAVTVPAGTAPVLVLPLSGLHESLADAEWDFGSEELEPFVDATRAVELVGVTVFFFVASVKLLGRFANV